MNNLEDFVNNILGLSGDIKSVDVKSYKSNKELKK